MRIFISFTERVFKSLNPDIIAITLAPFQGLGATVLHTFSLNNLLGLPLNFNIIYKDGNESAIYETLYSGSAGETISFTAWKKKIPVVPIGMPKKRPEIGERYPISGAFRGEEWKGFLDDMFGSFDEGIEEIEDFKEAVKFSEKLSYQFEDGSLLFSGKKEEIVEEACYCSSRLFDLLCTVNKSRITTSKNQYRYLSC